VTAPMGLYFRAIPNHPAVNYLPSVVKDVLGWLYWHRNRVTGQCNPKHETLAHEIGCSVRTIQRSIRMLKDGAFVRAIKGRRGCQFEIGPTDEWRKPAKRSCTAICVATPVAGQESPVLTEQEAVLLNKRVAAVPTVGSGGGGSPAALPEKTKTPDPDPSRTPKRHKNPIPPAKRPPNPKEPPNPEPSKEAAMHKTGILCAEYSEKAGELVAELLPQHPIAGNPAGAVKAISKVLAEGATPDSIRQSHSQFRKLWETFRPGRFIPQLARWINDNDWRYPPDDRQIGASRNPDDPEAMAKRRAELEQSSAARKAEELAAKERERLRGEREYEQLEREGRILKSRPPKIA
jgi:Helix-turn-helix domain